MTVHSGYPGRDSLTTNDVCKGGLCQGTQVHGTQQLTGYLTPAITGAPLVGPVPPDTPISLGIVLPIRDLTGLKSEIEDITNPSSPRYRRYYDVAGFADKYGAYPQDYSDVQTWAISKGLSISTYPNRLLLSVAGTAAAVEQALFVRMQYRRRPDGTMFYTPDREPSLNLGPSVLHISNLNNLSRLRKANVGGSGNGGLFRGADFRNAYACGASITGEGQTVGIVVQDGLSLSDINAYAQAVGFDTPDIKAISVDNGPLFQQCSIFPACDTFQSCELRTSCPHYTDGKPCCFNADGTADETCFTGCPNQSSCETTGANCPSGNNMFSLEVAMDIETVLAMTSGKARIRLFEGGTDGGASPRAIASKSPRIFAG